MCAQHVLLLSLTSASPIKNLSDLFYLWQRHQHGAQAFLVAIDGCCVVTWLIFSAPAMIFAAPACLPQSGSTLYTWRYIDLLLSSLHLSPFRSVSFHTSLPQTSSIFPPSSTLLSWSVCICHGLLTAGFWDGNDSHLKSWYWGLFVVDSVVLIEFLRHVNEQEQEHVAVIDR